MPPLSITATIGRPDPSAPSTTGGATSSVITISAGSRWKPKASSARGVSVPPARSAKP
ncbi:MAG: hypothetical protein WDN24_14520 [Sphingomonas sp.]